MRLKLKNIITITSCVLFLASCSSVTENKKLVLPQVTIVFEGPLYEGSNTGQSEINNVLDSFLTANKLTIENLKSAKLNLVRVESSDSNFNTLESISIQLASEKADMLQLGIINPLPEKATSVNLNISPTQEKLLESLNQPSIFIVADAIVKEDVAVNITITCNLEIELEVKK